MHSCALSDSDGAADLLISENDAGSSLLTPSQRCLVEYPQIRLIDRETVQVRPLDSLSLDPLPMPLQGVLMDDFIAAADAAGRAELINNPVGQIAGMLNRRRPAKEILMSMVEEAEGVLDRLTAMRR